VAAKRLWKISETMVSQTLTVGCGECRRGSTGKLLIEEIPTEVGGI
jgi:hypothetical protein